jgi:predicted  nucleic acid-binding Zn-ribbon protein
MLPDWLAEQSNGRLRMAAAQTELDAARGRVRRLRRRLSQRDAALTKVREKLVRQRQEIRRLRRRVERAETAAEQGRRSWRRRVSAAATRVLPSRGRKPGGP